MNKKDLTSILVNNIFLFIILLMNIFSLQAGELDSLEKQKIESKVYEYSKNQSNVEVTNRILKINKCSNLTEDGHIYVVGIESNEFEINTNLMIKFKKSNDEFLIESVFNNFYKYNLEGLDSIIIRKNYVKNLIEMFYSEQTMSSCKDQYYVLFEENNNNLQKIFDIKCYELSYSYEDCGSPLCDDKLISKLYKKYLQECSTEFSSEFSFDKSNKYEYNNIVMNYQIKEFLDEEKFNSFNGMIIYQYSKRKKKYLKKKSSMSKPELNYFISR